MNDCIDFISWAPVSGCSLVTSPCQPWSWMIDCNKLILFHELLIQVVPQSLLPAKQESWMMDCIKLILFHELLIQVVPQSLLPDKQESKMIDSMKSILFHELLIQVVSQPHLLQDKKVEWSIVLIWSDLMSSWYRFPDSDPQPLFLRAYLQLLGK